MGLLGMGRQGPQEAVVPGGGGESQCHSRGEGEAVVAGGELCFKLPPASAVNPGSKSGAIRKGANRCSVSPSMGGKLLVKSLLCSSRLLRPGQGSIPRYPTGERGSSPIGHHPIQYPCPENWPMGLWSGLSSSQPPVLREDSTAIGVGVASPWGRGLKTHGSGTW